MYVLGCYLNNESEVLDTATTNAFFQRLSARPLKQIYSGVCVVKSDVYLLGGFDSKLVQKYSAALDAWTVLPSLQYAIYCYFTCFVRGNTIRIYTDEGTFLESYGIGNE